MSQLLSRLQNEYAVLTDPVGKAEVAARMAGVFARQGRFTDARKVIGHIQQGFGKGESGQVTVMKMIAEGLVFHYEKLSPEANTRLLGALSLARMIGFRAGIALACAWKAHVEFERSEFASMAESLRTALANVDVDQHDAWVRIAAVMSNASLICGLSEKGQSWFKRGHEHAAKLGDTESIDALLYNKAAFSVAGLRVLACSDTVSSDLLSRARGEVNSARNLQQLAGVTALSAHVDLLNARLLILERDFEGAIGALQAVRVKEPFAAHNFHQSLMDLEIDYCQAMLGTSESSQLQDTEQLAGSLAELDVDDRLIALWMLREIHRNQGRDVADAGLEMRFAQTRREYESERASLRELMNSVS